MRSLLAIIFVLTISDVFTQGFSFNNPYIINYSKTEYKGGTENWKILPTVEGIVYSANNEGLLKFDGTTWKLYKLPNKTIVRSIAIDTTTNKIYTGGQDEFGYFEPNSIGELEFKSLKDIFPTEFKHIEDVWDINIVGKKVYFRSINKVFRYDGHQIEVIKTNSKAINSLAYINSKLYYIDPSIGMHLLTDKDNSFIKGSEVFINHRVSDVIDISPTISLFITEKNGIYLLKGNTISVFVKNDYFSNAILTSGKKIDDQKIALGSVLEGIILIDYNGNLLYSINKNKGLQTNNVIDLELDSEGNLWCATSNGIDQVLINSPFTLIYPDSDLQGSVYAIIIHQDILYVGTNNGLYFTNWPINHNSKFSMVKNSSGQVWALDIVNEDLFMGHNEGNFLIKDRIAQKISLDITGTWKSIQTPIKDAMISGTYVGFQLYKKIGTSWKFIQKIDGFNESARIITKDSDGNIWVSHPYRGVYKITFASDFTSIKNITNYGIEKGLPSSLSNYVTQLNNEIYVTAEKGIFKYNKNTDSFELEKEMTQLLGKDINIRTIFQERQSNIWFVNEMECGLLKINDSPTSKIVEKQNTPFLNGKLIGGFENIYIPDNNNVFVCTDKGLILIDMIKLQKKSTITLRFNNIGNQGLNNYKLYGGHGDLVTNENQFIYTQNSLEFYLSTNILDITNPIEYKYMVEGLDKKWSPWSLENKMLINNLQPGNYTFKAVARDSKGLESNEISYTFNILPPWYWNILAKIMYSLLVILTLFLLNKKINKKHEKEKIILKQEKEVSDAKVEELMNEKLQTEIDFKNKELALSTMHNVQKNETLSKLREELNHITKSIKEPTTKKQIKKVISILSDDQRLEDDWENFAIHFDQVHTDFIKRIKEEHPKLSQKDLKLCAYLRLNLTTKEIAPLFNISVRGVEISRYRLRKKMDLDSEINLNDFMMQY